MVPFFRNISEPYHGNGNIPVFTSFMLKNIRPMKKNGKMEYNRNGYGAFYTYDGLVRKRHGYVPLSGNGLKYSNNNIINLWKSEFTNDFCYLDRLSFFFNNRDHLGSTR